MNFPLLLEFSEQSVLLSYLGQAAGPSKGSSKDQGCVSSFPKSQKQYSVIELCVYQLVPPKPQTFP
jgi:hypothetical protein